MPLPEPVPGEDTPTPVPDVPGDGPSDEPSEDPTDDPSTDPTPDPETSPTPDPDSDTTEPATGGVEPISAKPDTGTGVAAGTPAPEADKGRAQLAETGGSDVTFGFGIAAGLMAIGAAGVVMARRGERA